MTANKSMFWHLVFNALRLRLQRVSIIFAALTVGASIVTAMAAVYFDINTKMSQELRAFGANFYIGSNGNNLIEEGQIEEIVREAPRGMLNAASPYLYGVARSELEKVVLMGVWFSDMKTLAPYWQINGMPIGVNFDDRNAMIGKRLSERLNLKIGDNITLSKASGEKRNLKIKAIAEAGDATDNMLIVSLAFAQQWLEKEGLANNALLSVNNESGQVEGFARELAQRFPDLDGSPIRKVSASEGQILDKIKGLMGLISAVILVLATLCVNTTLIAIVGERAKEFALQKALGAKPRDIVKQIGTETLIIAAAAILAGLAFGYLLAQVLGLAVFKSSIEMRWQVIPITCVLSLIVTLIAVIVPTKRALAIQITSVLKGE